MRRLLLRIFIATGLMSMAAYPPCVVPPPAFAESEALGDQVARILTEESAREKIKVIVLDFHVSFQNTDRKPSQDEMKDLSFQYTEEFIADIMQKLGDAGKQSRISVIDRGKLNDILRNAKPPEAAAADRTPTELGVLAGADVVITGSVKISDDASTEMVKTVRVKDGEILGIARSDSHEKPRPSFTPLTLIDEMQRIDIGKWKALPVNLTHSGTLHVAVDVEKGNPVDIVVISGGQLEHLKKNENFTSVTVFNSMRTRHYKREAPLESGSYYLVLRDSSLGVFSKLRSDIKIMVRLEP